MPSSYGIAGRQRRPHVATLVNALEQRRKRYGLHTMCEVGGTANATIIERLD
jgi:acetyl-CoA acetyltransferase